ncbi:MAG: hypothetical protein HYX91_01450 [Chloroflexi bacterium]|nr:hypothetical protein [Chloroflexota bacterium]
MDQARVIIDLKEGIIELEGPVDFVRHYLETYQPATKPAGGRARRSSPVSTVTPPPRVKPPGARGRRAKAEALPAKEKAVPVEAKKPKPVSCTQAVGGYIDEGFFDQPRSIGEISKHLKETGVNCTGRAVKVSLTRLTGAGALATAGKGRGVRYHRFGL